MICERCKNKEAVVHYAEVINNKVKKLHLCEECAMAEGIGVQPPFSIGELMGGLTPQKLAEAPLGKVACPVCGMTLNKFKQTGRLGCYQCYEAFRAALQPLFAGIHKSTRHIGKIPQRALKLMDGEIKMRELERKLQEAVKNEEYELAARLRDEIRTIQQAKRPKTAAADQRRLPPAKDQK